MANLFGNKQERTRRVPGGSRLPAQDQTSKIQQRQAPASQFPVPARDVHSLPDKRRRTKRKRIITSIVLCLVVAVLVFSLFFGIFCLVDNLKDRFEAYQQKLTEQIVQTTETTKPEEKLDLSKPSTPSETTVPTEQPTEPPTEAPTEPSTEAPTEPPTEPFIEIEQTATISATGDILMHIPVIKSGYNSETKKYNFKKIFQYLDDYSKKADYAVANLETTLAGSSNGYKYAGYPNFNCPDSITDALKSAGFDMLLTANNHCYDTSTVGLTRTLKVAAERGLATLGTQATSKEKDYIVKDLNGIKVGMICYSYATKDDYPERPSMNGILVKSDYAKRISYFDTDKLDKFYKNIKAQISAMKDEGAEAIVLYIHWGEEYQTKPNSTQKSMAQKLCDLGVDVIVGGHPHVVQPVQLLTSTKDEDHKTVCLYSMGNALSNQRKDLMNLNTGHTEDGVLFSFTFAKYSDGEVLLDSVKILPTWVYMKKGSSKNTYRILPLDKKISNWGETFDISDSAVKAAKNSYDRTTAIVGKGVKASNAFLTERRQAKLEDNKQPEMTTPVTTPEVPAA